MLRFDQNEKRIRKYWSDITGIPLKQFFNTKPDIRTKGKPTRKTAYKGVCGIQYSDTSLQCTLQSIGEIIIIGSRGNQIDYLHKSIIFVRKYPELRSRSSL